VKIRLLLILVYGAIVITGCATQDQSLVNHLQMRVGDLERQLEMRDDQLKDLRYEIKDLSYEIDRLKLQRHKNASKQRSAKKTVVKKHKRKTNRRIIRVNVSIGSIQKALKSAGFYEGPVDGKIGARTKSAIADFQKEHGLKDDGIVGQETWTELKTYLD
jgi:murein L,D-transpeptidase YcbB/YkuD